MQSSNFRTGSSLTYYETYLRVAFMMNDGNILVLQRALGHANLTMTIRYVHLAPDNLQGRQTQPVDGVDTSLTVNPSCIVSDRQTGAMSD